MKDSAGREVKTFLNPCPSNCKSTGGCDGCRPKEELVKKPQYNENGEEWCPLHQKYHY